MNIPKKLRDNYERIVGQTSFAFWGFICCRFIQIPSESVRNRRSLLLIAINNSSLSHYRFHLDIGTRGRRKSENRISFICVIKRKAKKALEWSLWTWLKALSLGFTGVECLWWNVINFAGLFCTEAIYMKPSNLRGHKALSMQNTKSRFNPSESIVELMNMMCPLTSRNVRPSPTKCNYIGLVI